MPCGETKCGSIYEGTASIEMTAKASGISKKAGFGLYTRKRCVREKRIGSFGGQLLCALCARKKKKKDGKEGKYKAIEVEQDFGHTLEASGVYWYIYRTGSGAVDGDMWFINSSREKNKRGYKHPNVYFKGIGFYSDGTPAIEVFTLTHIESDQELLAKYMK